MNQRQIRRIQARKSKSLFDLSVEYAFYVSKLETRKAKKRLFNFCNEIWTDRCFNARMDKMVNMNHDGFKMVAGTTKQVRAIQKTLGLPLERYTLLTFIKSYL